MTLPITAMVSLTASLLLGACSGSEGTGTGQAAAGSSGSASAAAGLANAGAPDAFGGASAAGSGGTMGGAVGLAGSGGAAAGTTSSAGNANSAGTANGAGAPGSGGAGAGGAPGAAGAAGAAGSPAGGAPGIPAATVKPRVVVLTDIANEPDDEESLVRFLVYANEFDVEALIAITSRHLKSTPREDLIRRQLDAYEKVYPNLIKHDPGFPTAASLRTVTKTGQTTYGMAAVGTGKATAGSQHLISVVDKADTRPVWMTVWGGANTLAQALLDVRAARSAEELSRFVAKLRVYSISDQDDAGAWLRKEFPSLFYVVTPSPAGASEYKLSTWSGISGDRFYANGPGYQFDLVDNPWLSTNVRQGHGPLGALYPAWKYIMEGDTPAYLGLIEHGLGSAVSPSYGGWGGRYALSTPSGEPRAIWTNSSDKVTYGTGQTATSNQATIWRWREHYQSDFAARMDWCIADTFAKANHNPLPTLNGDRSKQVLTLSAKAGTRVPLTALGTSDPDGNSVVVKWWLYPEAGTFAGVATLSQSQGLSTEVVLPASGTGKLHVIAEARDNGVPSLFGYRRLILDVTP